MLEILFLNLSWITDRAIFIWEIILLSYWGESVNHEEQEEL